MGRPVLAVVGSKVPSLPTALGFDYAYVDSPLTSVPRPSVQEGDLLIAFVVIRNNGSTQASNLSVSGWTSRGIQQGNSFGLQVYSKVAGASEPATYSGFTVGTSYSYVSIAAYRYATWGAITSASSTSTNTISAPSVSLTARQMLIRQIIIPSATPDPDRMISPGDYIEQADGTSGVYGIFFAYRAVSESAVVTGAESFTHNQGNIGYRLYSVVLNPVA